MNEVKQIYLVNQLVGISKEEFSSYVNDWVTFVRILIKPKFVQFNNDKPESYQLEKVADFLEKTGDQEYWITISNDDNFFSLNRSGTSLMEKNLITEKVYQEGQSIIEDYQITRLQAKGLYGYVRPYEEYLINNTVSVEERYEFQTHEEIRQLPKRKTDEDKIVVDCDQLAGYDIFLDGLCLTSCWKMYFSKHYYRVILKEILMDVQQVESARELDQQLVEITLYNDPANWKHPVNLSFQQLFRDQMGFNQIACNNGVGVLKDPYIEYAYRKNLIQTVQYQNNKLQPTEKKAATHFVTRTYDHFREAYREKRVFGILNTQAYFPWVNESNSSMMNYKVLNPKLTLDNGLNAYEYYIRAHLEINVKDDKYDEFITELQFYIPEELIAAIPIDSLRDRLADVKIGKTKKSKGNVRLDMEKGENHLRVVFLGQHKLEQIEEPHVV